MEINYLLPPRSSPGALCAPGRPSTYCICPAGVDWQHWQLLTSFETQAHTHSHTHTHTHTQRQLLTVCLARTDSPSENERRADHLLYELSVQTMILRHSDGLGGASLSNQFITNNLWIVKYAQSGAECGTKIHRENSDHTGPPPAQQPQPPPKSHISSNLLAFSLSDVCHYLVGSCH